MMDLCKPLHSAALHLFLSIIYSFRFAFGHMLIPLEVPCVIGAVVGASEPPESGRGLFSVLASVLCRPDGGSVGETPPGTVFWLRGGRSREAGGPSSAVGRSVAKT